MGKAIFYERGVKMLVKVGGTTLQSQIFGRNFLLDPKKRKKCPKFAYFYRKKAHFSTKKQNRSVTLFSSLLAIV